MIPGTALRERAPVCACDDDAPGASISRLPNALGVDPPSPPRSFQRRVRRGRFGADAGFEGSGLDGGVFE